MNKLQGLWNQRGLNWITPRDRDNPEGFDIGDFLSRNLPSGGPILEFGCGRGRLAKFFESHWYEGIDFNENAVEKARKAKPEHAFSNRTIQGIGTEFAAAFAYTVLLHIPDDEIKEVADHISEVCETFTVFEIMGRKWRRRGNPPVFNREPEEYIEIFKAAGGRLVSRDALPYKHYATNPAFKNHPTDIVALRFSFDGES